MALNNILVTENEGAKPIPEGLYKACVKEIVENNGQHGVYLRIAFEIIDGTYKGTVKNTLASLKLYKSQDGKNSKLFDLVKAVLKTEPTVGSSLDLMQLIGKPCQILVMNGKITDGIQYQEISKVLPE